VLLVLDDHCQRHPGVPARRAEPEQSERVSAG
jgi:hypothetical protein